MLNQYGKQSSKSSIKDKIIRRGSVFKSLHAENYDRQGSETNTVEGDAWEVVSPTKSSDITTKGSQKKINMKQMKLFRSGKSTSSLDEY